MNSKISWYSILFASLLSLAACGGGDVSEFSDDDIPSPVGGGVDGVDPSDPGADPVDGETLASLPRVNAGNRIFADPNVLVNLNGSAVAAEGATIATTIWTQVSGPSVVIPNANQLSTSILIPDLIEDSLLVFRLTAVDSQGRVNSAVVNILVSPSPVFARVIGEVAEVGQESVVFTVRLNAAQANDVTINYATEDGTATAGIDYVATTGSLVIPAGQTQAQITVPILPATLDGVDESFVLRITVIASDGQNNTSNVGVVLLRDTPDLNVAAPILADLVTPILRIGVPMEPLAFVNSGGGNVTCAFVPGDGEGPTVPEWLNVAASEDGRTCVLSGTPSALVLVSGLGVTATNTSGSATASFDLRVEAALAPPQLILPSPLVAPVGSDIGVLSIANTGGGELTDCDDAESLPPGLTLSVDESALSCEISGTPTQITEGPINASITATNPAGTSTIEVSIEITVAPPVLEIPPAQVFFVGEEILAFEISTNPTTPLTECRSLEVLPAGLEIGLSEGQTQCVISGIPSEASAASIFTIRASNAAGSGDIAVSIEVQDLVQSVRLNLATSQPVCAIGLATNGGLVTVDWNDGSPVEVINNQDVDEIDAAEAGALEHTFVVQGEAPIAITLTLSRGIASLIGFADNGCAYQMNVTDLLGAENMEVLKLTGLDGSLSGALADLSANHPLLRDLEIIRVPVGSDGPSFFGELNELPPNLERFVTVAGVDLLTDPQLTDIPPSLQTLDIQQLFRTVTGSIDNIPGNLTSLRISDFSQIGGNLRNLRADMERLILPSGNAVVGSLADITNNGGLELNLQSQQASVTGVVAEIPNTITRLTLSGFAEISGNIEDLHPDMEVFNISSNEATIAGDIGALTNNGQLELRVAGRNTIGGNIALLSENVVVLDIQGENSIGGDIGQMQADNLVELSIGGQNQLSTFGSEAAWSPSRLQILNLSGGGLSVDGGLVGFTSDEVDALLIRLNSQIPALANPNEEAFISLERAGDEPSTAASAAAVIELEEKGFEVFAAGGGGNES